MSQEQSLGERHRGCNLTVLQSYGYTARVAGINTSIPEITLLYDGTLMQQHYKG